MALHEPEVECCCDVCAEQTWLTMKWSIGGYNLTDEQAKIELTTDKGWYVKGNNHFCSVECLEEFTQK